MKFNLCKQLLVYKTVGKHKEIRGGFKGPWRQTSPKSLLEDFFLEIFLPFFRSPVSESYPGNITCEGIV